MLELVAGVIFSLVLIGFSIKCKASHWLYSLSLASLPLIYMLFGIFADDTSIILRELLYGLPFIVAAVFCLRVQFKKSGYFVAAMWLIHGFYDLYHDHLFINAGVPVWYPLFCAVVDVTMFIYLVSVVSKLPNQQIHKLGRVS